MSVFVDPSRASLGLLQVPSVVRYLTKHTNNIFGPDCFSQKPKAKKYIPSRFLSAFRLEIRVARVFLRGYFLVSIASVRGVALHVSLPPPANAVGGPETLKKLSISHFFRGKKCYGKYLYFAAASSAASLTSSSAISGAARRRRAETRLRSSIERELF